MLSVTCKTAIRAVIFLAVKHEGKERAGIKEIALSIKANAHTVAKVLQHLVREDIIKSSKGPTGGFSITPAQLQLPIASIVNAIDGKELFKSCGLGLAKCSVKHPCPIHDDYKEIRDAVGKFCRHTKIIELYLTVTAGSTYLAG